MPHPELLLIFFVIAFVYASVGFGGGSSYLAVLALYALPFQEIRLVALMCNIIVVTGGTLVFIRHAYVVWDRILPLLIFSIPMAYLGGQLRISETAFFIILGCSLVAAAILLWLMPPPAATGEPVYADRNVIRDGFLGGTIGFLSGMAGIGGGIFLSPILFLMRWDSPKRIAATASVFILVNSVAGMIGQVSRPLPPMNGWRAIALCGAVLAGGQVGSRIGAVRFNPLVIRRLTALLVFIAGSEVLIRHLSLSL